MIRLNTSFKKTCGLPNFSSITCGATIETELTDLEQAPVEIAKLTQILRNSVDRELQQVGFVPSEDFGLRAARSPKDDRNHTANGSATNGNGSNGNHQASDTWNCTQKQRELITDLQTRLRLSDKDLNERSLEVFSKPANQLKKLCASGLITNLLEEAGQSNGHRNGRHNGNGSAIPAKSGGR